MLPIVRSQLLLPFGAWSRVNPFFSEFRPFSSPPRTKPRPCTRARRYSFRSIPLTGTPVLLTLTVSYLGQDLSFPFFYPYLPPTFSKRSASLFLVNAEPILFFPSRRTESLFCPPPPFSIQGRGADRDRRCLRCSSLYNDTPPPSRLRFPFGKTSSLRIRGFLSLELRKGLCLLASTAT